MGYTVTIKNDAEFCNGENIVHTWLVFTDPTGEEKTFGFSPKDHAGYFNVEGAIDKDNYLAKRNYSQSKTFDVTKQQFDQMISAKDSFSDTPKVYDLLPDNSSGNDYNCTTAADSILKAAGITFLDGVQSPFGVAGRIDGSAMDSCPVNLSDNVGWQDILSPFLAPFTKAITADYAFTLGDKTYDLGLAETTLDAKDFVDELMTDAWDIFSGWFSGGADEFGGAAFASDFLVSLYDGMMISKAEMDATIDWLNSLDNVDPSAWINELMGKFQQDLFYTAAGLKALADGDAASLNALGSMPLLSNMFFDFMFNNNSDPSASGPSMAEARNSVYDPIIIDLDKDGIETLSLKENIFFDHDGNQFAEKTGWVGKDDGLLVADRNHDGLIENGNELFGNNTILQNGKTASNGYEALREYDSNNDGVIDQQDDRWSELHVWQDKNSNAKVDEGELFSLEKVGIKSINTLYSEIKTSDQQGNMHTQQSDFTWADGSSGQTADVWFTLDKSRTKYKGDADINSDVLSLPYVRGFGNMKNLHIAMSENIELRKLVEQYVADPAVSHISKLIDEIIFTWADVTNEKISSRGSHIDARVVGVLEAATGEQYRSADGNSSMPHVNAAAIMQEEYQKLSNYIEASLLAQTLYAKEFSSIGISFDKKNSGFKFNFDYFVSSLDNLKITDIKKCTILSNILYHYLEYSPSYWNVREKLSINPDVTFIGDKNENILTAQKKDSVLWGKEGDDRLFGETGNDTYLFEKGHGHDIVTDRLCTTTNNLVFEDANSEQLSITRAGDNMIISVYGENDSVTLQKFFSSDAGFRHFSLTFSDRTISSKELSTMGFPAYGTNKNDSLYGWNNDDILIGYDGNDYIYAGDGNDILQGGNGDDLLVGELGNDTLDGGMGNDQLYGYAGDDLMQGGDGSDTLFGNQGKDILDGGTGNDILQGGDGSDIYIFRIGHGHDIIDDKATSALNKLIFEGAHTDQLSMLKSDSDLIISIYGEDDTLTLCDFFTSSDFQHFELIFDDRTISMDELVISGFPVYGTDDNDSLYGWRNNDSLYGNAGNDTLSGNQGKDVLDGGTGSDILQGGDGSDTYLFRAGHGQDTIDDKASSAINTLVFESANSSQLILLKSGRDLVISVYGDNDNITLSKYFDDVNYRHFSLTFDDRTITVDELAGMGYSIYGTESDDSLSGWNNDDYLYGYAGNDRLSGGGGSDILDGDKGDDNLEGDAGKDTLDGGAGNDTLQGGDGSDTYLFRAGHGQDIITDKANSATNSLIFEGASLNYVTMEKSGNDLVLHAYQSEDTVTLTGYFSTSDYRHFQLIFDDQTITVDELPALVTDSLAKNSSSQFFSVRHSQETVTMDTTTEMLWFTQGHEAAGENIDGVKAKLQQSIIAAPGDAAINAQLHQLIEAMTSFTEPDMNTSGIPAATRFNENISTYLTTSQ